MKRALISLPLLFGLALAWTPNPDLDLATRVVQSAYNRIATVPTALFVDLAVRDRRFADRVDVKLLRDNPAVCLENWLNAPTNYAQFGSRPTSITLAGQADLIKLEAQKARNAFRNIAPREALTAAQAILPPGHLRIFVEIAGLENVELRAAYTLGLVGATPDQFILPYRSTFLDDWRNQGGRFSGTMVYYFDMAQTNINPRGPLTLALKTESDLDCAYTITLDLSRFE